MNYKHGIDVSYHQGVIDWDKVRQDGVDFAILRAGYGRNNIDKQFVRNAQECSRLGIPFGVYWFSYAYNVEMARAEARYCLQAIAPYRLSYPVAFDFEYDSVRYAKEHGVNVGKTLASEMARAFCNEVESSGYYAVVYANPDYLNNYFESEMPSRYDIWLAQWPNSPDPSEKPSRAGGLWQYSSSGAVNGITGRVDMNYAYKGYPSIIGYIPTPAPIVQPDPKPEVVGDDDMSYEQWEAYMNQYKKKQQQKPGSSWSAADRAWALQNCLIQGDEYGNAMWQDDISREQIIAVLHRYDNMR